VLDWFGVVSKKNHSGIGEQAEKPQTGRVDSKVNLLSRESEKKATEKNHPKKSALKNSIDQKEHAQQLERGLSSRGDSRSRHGNITMTSQKNTSRLTKEWTRRRATIQRWYEKEKTGQKGRVKKGPATRGGKG